LPQPIKYKLIARETTNKYPINFMRLYNSFFIEIEIDFKTEQRFSITNI